MSPKSLGDEVRDNIRDAIRDSERGGYTRDDAAKDTGSSRDDVDRAWGEAASDGGNGESSGDK